MTSLHHVFRFFSEVGVSGLIDITLVSLFVYAILVFFKRTQAGFVLSGILIISVVYLCARIFNLFLVSFVLQGFFAVILIALVVIFQEELRHFFEQIAIWSLERNPGARRKTGPIARREIEILVRTVFDLGRERVGALIVLRGRDAIVRHLTGGIDLGGVMSEPILKSIFDPHSPGHDGAVLIEDNKIQRYACHLPLSKNLEKLKRGGTRHAAALGMSELCDALCLVVSEERGTVSIARSGDLIEIPEPARLAGIVGDFYAEVEPATEKRKPWHDFFKSNYREKVAALIVTFALWYVFVHESVVVYRTYQVPVEPSGVAEKLVITELKPKKLKVTFSGPRRAFYFVDASDIHAPLKLYAAKKGTKTLAVTASDLSFPTSIHVEGIEPGNVYVKIEDKKAATP